MPEKVIVWCYTGTKKLSESSFQYVSEQFEIEPTGLVRWPCGSGKASKRYHYTVLFIAPSGVIDCNMNPIQGTETRESIFRRTNSKWMPPKEGWTGNVWRPEQVTP